MEDYTFRLTSTGVLLNDDGSTPFVDVLRVTGLDSPEFRVTNKDHEGDDGGFMDAEFEKGRTILLDARVYSGVGSLESYLDNLKENFAPRHDVVPFYFQAPGVVERLLYVKPLGCAYDWSAPRAYGCADVQLKAYAEDPRIYSSSLHSVTVTLGGTVTQGFGFSLGFDFGFGTATVGGGNNAANAGNRETPALFTIPGPVTNPAIYNDTTGAVMQFANLIVNSGESLVVDTNYRTVRLNGTTNRRSTLTQPVWIRLVKGDNTLRFLSESGGSSMTVDYRDAWR